MNTEYVSQNSVPQALQFSKFSSGARQLQLLQVAVSCKKGTKSSRVGTETETESETPGVQKKRRFSFPEDISRENAPVISEKKGSPGF